MTLCLKTIYYRELKGDRVHAEAKDTEGRSKERNPDAHVAKAHELCHEDCEDAGDPVEQLGDLLHPSIPGKRILFIGSFSSKRPVH